MKRTLTTAALATSIMLASLSAALGAERTHRDCVVSPPMSAGEWVTRVERVSPGRREFMVTDQHGHAVRVVRPPRPPQAATIRRARDLVNDSAVREGDTVLLTGVLQGSRIAADRVEVLDPTRLGGTTSTEKVLRFTRFDGGSGLRAVSADGAEHRILLPPRPQAIGIVRGGDLINLSALREGDRFVANGAERDGVILANRLEILDGSRLGGGAGVPLRLTYRGSAGWRRLIGEGADGSRYTVALPHRPQALYFRRKGTLVEPSALAPGQTIEVHGVLRGDRIEATEVVLR